MVRLPIESWSISTNTLSERHEKLIDMASKKTLNAQNLETLGAERLAQLLIEISTGDAGIKRRLRLELAGAQGPAEVAREVRKRLTTIARSRSFVDWHNRSALVSDLSTQHRAIVEQVGSKDPAEALDLMWRFLALADSVFARCDDSSGTVIEIFHDAIDSLGTIAETARPNPIALADRVYTALNENDYGQYDGLIETLAPTMGNVGLQHLKGQMIELANKPTKKPKASERQQIGFSSRGPIYADDLEETSRKMTTKSALKTIADIQGDVDAFISQYDEDARREPRIAAVIANRLLAAGRPTDALQTLDQTDPDWPRLEDATYDDARAAVLEALDRPQEAQDIRWAYFERSLSSDHLRDYLKRLPDFDDLEAEEKALQLAESHPSIIQALWFLISWPAHDRAARFILDHATAIDGNFYEVLTPASEAMAGKHPLAATLLLRSMIDFSLERARTSRYGYAARHLLGCESLATSITDFGDYLPHAEYVALLREKHGRKSSFWSRLK